MLLPLFSASSCWVAQQPLMQQKGIHRSDIRLTPQAPAHVQQIICCYLVLHTFKTHSEELLLTDGSYCVGAKCCLPYQSREPKFGRSEFLGTH